MPQSAFLVGLAPRFWRSQQNYYIMFYNTVVLEGSRELTVFAVLRFFCECYSAGLDSSIVGYYR